METKHIRILDDVLNYLYNNRTCEKGKQRTHTIISLTKVFTELDISDIENILQKFCKDGYADKTINPLGEKGLIYYYITFEGRVFKEACGYKEKVNKESILSLKSERDENRAKVNEILSVISFALAAIGSLIIAYWEIKKQYPLFPYLK
jgi:DNA-binding MarR family transcriptional regulator